MRVWEKDKIITLYFALDTGSVKLSVVAKGCKFSVDGLLRKCDYELVCNKKISSVFKMLSGAFKCF